MGVGAEVALKVRVTDGKIRASVRLSVSVRVRVGVGTPNPYGLVSPWFQTGCLGC